VAVTEPQETFEARTAPVVYAVSLGLLGGMLVLLAALKNASALSSVAFPAVMGIVHLCGSARFASTSSSKG
jgi:hypothetical protein